MRAIQVTKCVLLMFATGCGGAAATPAAPAMASAPAPAPAAAPAPPADPDAAAVEAARPSLRACYEKARGANPSLGRVMVTLTLRVDEAGHVTTVNLQYDHRFDDAAKGCMRDAAFAIQLPPGQPRRLELPVAFQPR